MQVKAKKKKEEKKPQKAMDAGARGRRLLQRREYRAKVSEFIPKELEDHVVYENDALINTINKASTFMQTSKNPVVRGLRKVFKSDGGKNYPTQQQYKNSVQQNSYEPEGEMTEANSAQMKAMHDAKMKKKEDDKVAEKKKDMKEGSAYGITRGSGKPSGAFKDYLDKKKKEKKKVDEACWKGYEKKGMKTMFGKRYPNCVKKTKKEEVEVAEDMKGMSQKSGDKRSTESGAGMTAQGVAKYNRRTGGNLKTAVTTPPSKLKPGSKAAKRRKSFCARSKSWTGPRGKAARRRWNCSYEPELPMIIDEKKKLFNTAPLSDRVSNWSKKINEGDVYVKSNRNRLTGLPNLGKGDKKTTEKKITGVNYATMAQSYEPQGEMIESAYTDFAKKFGLDPVEDYAKIKRMMRQQNLKGVNNWSKGPYKKGDKMYEAKMTSAEKDKKEKYVKGMKKDKKGFTKRYGKDGESVMYATATKMAMKEESCGKGQYYCYDDKKCKPIPEGMKVGKDGMLVKEDFYKKKYDVRKGGYQKTNKMTKSNKRSGDSKAQYRQVHKDLAKENALIDKIKNDFNIVKKAKDTVNKYNQKLQKNNDAINKIMPGTASMKNEQQIPNLPGLGGGGGGTNAITAKAQTKSLGNYAKDILKIGTIPARFMLNIKSPQDPLSKFAAPTTPAGKVDSAIANYKRKLNMGEGSLHKWFKGSKSKDGKPGWVNVVTGGTCASDKPGEGTPKCVSSSKRASMTKAERLSASRRKKKADPGQQSKSGAAKPTYVATDSKKKK